MKRASSLQEAVDIIVKHVKQHGSISEREVSKVITPLYECDSQDFLLQTLQEQDFFDEAEDFMECIRNPQGEKVFYQYKDWDDTIRYLNLETTKDPEALLMVQNELDKQKIELLACLKKIHHRIGRKQDVSSTPGGSIKIFAKAPKPPAPGK